MAIYYVAKNNLFFCLQDLPCAPKYFTTNSRSALVCVRLISYPDFPLSYAENPLAVGDLGTKLVCAMLVQTGVAKRVDLPTSRAQIFSRARSTRGRFFMLSAAKANERAGTRIVFPAKNRILSVVILARTICVPVACVVASVCRRELSKYVKTNK